METELRGVDLLAKYPWLADSDAARKMTAKSNLPVKEGIEVIAGDVLRHGIEKTIQYSYYVGTKPTKLTDVGRHVGIDAEVSNGTWTMKFYMEDGPPRSFTAIKKDTKPLEILTITGLDWSLTVNGVKVDSGKLTPYQAQTAAIKKARKAETESAERIAREA